MKCKCALLWEQKSHLSVWLGGFSYVFFILFMLFMLVEWCSTFKEILVFLFFKQEIDTAECLP